MANLFLLFNDTYIVNKDNFEFQKRGVNSAVKIRLQEKHNIFLNITLIDSTLWCTKAKMYISSKYQRCWQLIT